MKKKLSVGEEKGRHATNLIALKSMVIFLQAKIINELLPPINELPFCDSR